MEQVRSGVKANANAVVTGFEQHRRSTTKTNYRALAIGIVALVAAVVIVFTAMQGSTVYYQTVAEFTQKVNSGTIPDDHVRVNGKVVPNTISYNATHSQVSFTAVDLTDSASTLKVTYSGVIPDTFKDDAQVVVTGNFNQGSGTFLANEMLAKCPSKYQASSDN
jgi:cytochrome c-type biogenesis protein CcmE